MSDKRYEFADVQSAFATKAAGQIARRYRHVGVTFEDALQEMMLWLYGDGRPRVERWLESDPQQTTRIYRSLVDRGVKFGEREKAHRAGYDADDVHWYTATSIEALLPLVLDPTYDGMSKSGEQAGRSGKPKNQQGDLLAMVVDIRRVLPRLTTEQVGALWEHEPGHPSFDDAVQALLNLLGGARSGGPGARRRMSNAQAIAVTSEQEAS